MTYRDLPRSFAKRAAGFTLMEVMITVAIIGILSAIAIPSYSDYVTRGKLVEAHSTLANMRVRLEQFYQDNRTYAGAPVCTMTTGTNFTYTCPTLNATLFTAQATGIAAQGTGSFTFTIDQENVRKTPAAPSGWTTSNPCWVSKKGGC